MKTKKANDRYFTSTIFSLNSKELNWIVEDFFPLHVCKKNLHCWVISIQSNPVHVHPVEFIFSSSCVQSIEEGEASLCCCDLLGICKLSEVWQMSQQFSRWETCKEALRLAGVFSVNASNSDSRNIWSQD